MKTMLITIAMVVALGGLYVLLPLVINTFQRYRNKRVKICPETGSLAEVDIDARRAALTSAIGRPHLRIKNCTLWPKKKGCGEDCLKGWHQGLSSSKSASVYRHFASNLLIATKGASGAEDNASKL